LLFYLRIFTDGTFKKWVLGLITVNIIYIIVFDFVVIFQCNPIEGAWLQWDGTFEGSCYNINIPGWTSGVSSIVLGVAEVILPIPRILKLNMTRARKFSLVGMFGVGIL
jgi:hypothetical protein